MAPWPTISQNEHCDHVLTATDRFAEALERHPLSTPVPTCPGWDLRALAVHTGNVHRWAGQAAATGTRPQGQPGEPPPEGSDGDALAAWLRDGAAALVATLRDLDPAAPTWHPFPVAQVAGVWPRRQAHETAVHAWDALHAVGSPVAIDPTLALDGIAEYFELVVPRLVARDGLQPPAGTFSVEADDLGHAVAVSFADGEIVVTRDHPSPDGVLRGTAAACLGRLWNRPMGDDVELDGDPAVAAAWLALPGM